MTHEKFVSDLFLSHLKKRLSITKNLLRKIAFDLFHLYSVFSFL